MAEPEEGKNDATALGTALNSVLRFVTEPSRLAYGAVLLLVAIMAMILWRTRRLHDLAARLRARLPAGSHPRARLAEIFADPSPRAQHDQIGRYLADALNERPAQARTRFRAAYPEAAPLLDKLEGAAFGDAAGDDGGSLAADEQSRLRRLLAGVQANDGMPRENRDPLPPLFAHETR